MTNFSIEGLSKKEQDGDYLCAWVLEHVPKGHHVFAAKSLPEKNRWMKLIGDCYKGDYKKSAPKADTPARGLSRAWGEIPRQACNITGILGCGRFGNVFEGRIGETQVAIKEIKRGFISRERFLQEADKLKLQKDGKMKTCRYVLDLISVISETQPFWIVSELQAGGCLKECLADTSRGPMSIGLRTRLASQIAAALIFLLEEVGVVHKDVAARNAMYDGHHTCKLRLELDYQLETQLAPRLNPYEEMGFEPNEHLKWCAPEVHKSGVHDHASDIWSFGVFLWEVGTHGQAPYEDFTVKETVQRVKSYTTLPAVPSIPAVLHNLCEKCWARAPADRPHPEEPAITAVIFFERVFFLISLGPPHVLRAHMWALNTRGEPNEIESTAAHRLLCCFAGCSNISATWSRRSRRTTCVSRSARTSRTWSARPRGKMTST